MLSFGCLDQLYSPWLLFDHIFPKKIIQFFQFFQFCTLAMICTVLDFGYVILSGHIEMPVTFGGNHSSGSEVIGVQS